ncbi:glycosyltransferase family protein [Pectinatus cerevisiiphilus]|uniref:Glycosyl transferase family 2 n=1 Tax=Pectinatus cerevisiiphilus TaxID=86956 RepID=A0A4R3K9R5_9FIRM|nr:glycosyltransferase family protein [Pectinatus cerevisiiphilus]TCS79623.1 glycosyl transferase family 2 [Pectinatus cerevisiiphilus]
MKTNPYIDGKKICFIVCTNDEKKYNKCLQFIRKINIPNGYKKENLIVYGAHSITSGYNAAMKKTNAKYKIYLHHDVYIINSNIIYDILNLFKTHPKLGLLGIAGAKLLPTNCIWGAGTGKYGKIYHYFPKEDKVLFTDFSNGAKMAFDYEDVEAIDGVLMITQYDIFWREDIFKGWHYYDLSQCMEFKKNGYKVGIPNVDEPWCIHETGMNLTGYKEAQKIFIKEYGKFLGLY